MRHAALLLSGLLFNQAAFAGTVTASFDCRKAVTAVERTICSDSKLAALDRELAKAFAEAKQANAQDREFLKKSQSEWLQKRSECSSSEDNSKQVDIPCLQRIYAQRIKFVTYSELWPPFREAKVDRAIARLREMNPQDLLDITTFENRDALSDFSCRFFEKDPVAASQTFAAYFGSTMDGWNPLCSKIDIADRVPEVKALLAALDLIWGSDTPCDGTMRVAYGRRDTIIRILAAVDPDPMTNEKAIPAPVVPDSVYTPDLYHWSQQGNWEKRQYDALQPLLKNAQIALAGYYEAAFHTSKSQAEAAAQFHVTQMLREKTGQSGASSAYMSLCFDKGDLDSYIKTSSMPEKICPYAEFVDMSKEATLRRFLGLAIVNRYPVSVIERLIADGAEMDPKKVQPNPLAVINDSPLMLAAPYPEVIPLLLKAGAQVNASNGFGKTALMYAIQEHNMQSIALLLKAGADVNAKTSEDVGCSALKAGGRTALMYAAWQGTPEIIRMLVDAGADIAAQDTNHDSALSYLERNEALGEKDRFELKKLLAADVH